MEKGMKVTLIGERGMVFGTFRNVTEIHQNYHSDIPGEKKTAFESDIHGTGITYPTEIIKEMVVVTEKEIAKHF